jgi:hypothetical protein
MATTDRKAAIDSNKTLKVPAGIYLLTHTGSGRRWVGHAADLDAIMNRILFTLRLGSHHRTDLQATWNADREGLAFERIETFEADAAPQGEALKARLRDWRVKLDALPL